MKASFNWICECGIKVDPSEEHVCGVTTGTNKKCAKCGIPRGDDANAEFAVPFCPANDTPTKHEWVDEKEDDRRPWKQRLEYYLERIYNAVDDHGEYAIAREQVFKCIESAVSESLRMAAERVRGMKLGPLVGKYGQSKDSYNEALEKASESIIKG